jgi:Na+/H+ antiporter NhaD/arsenite permease-like protein
LTYILIASEKVDKSVAALLGACAILFAHNAPYGELMGKVDLNVIFLLIGMMICMDILARTGVFEWIAIVVAQKAKGNGLLIAAAFMMITAFVSAFLDNVTTVILIAPITILIAQMLEIPAVPILIMEAVFSNIGGTATLIGDPPNVIIGSQAKLSFNDFINNLTPVILIVAVVSLLAMILLMKRRFTARPGTKERIMKAKPEKAIVDPLLLKRALPVLALTIIGFFLSRLIHVEAGIVALCGGLLMVIVCKVEMRGVLEKVEWTTIMFFIGLFIVIGALEINGVFQMLGKQIIALTNGNLLLTAITILWFSAILSAIVDNIPLVIAMIPLIKSIVPVFARQMGIDGAEELVKVQIEQPLYWSLALGACLGGNGTLIGASANVVISQIARRNKYNLTFACFTKYGFPMMLLSLVICTLYVYLRYF